MLPFNTSIRSYRFYMRDSVSGGVGPLLTTNFASAKFELVDKGVDKTNFKKL
jgi:hypothetical protein